MSFQELLEAAQSVLSDGELRTDDDDEEREEEPENDDENDNDKDEDFPVSFTPEKTNDPERRFRCLHEGCSYTARSRSGQKSHMKMHTRPYQCTWPDCGAAFSRQRELDDHGVIHGSRKFHCDHSGCDRSFARKSTLTRHKRSIHENKPREKDPKKSLVCEWPGCGKSFQFNSRLKQHRMSHEGTKPYACVWPECTYRGTTKSHLNSHQRSRKHFTDRNGDSDGNMLRHHHEKIAHEFNDLDDIQDDFQDNVPEPDIDDESRKNTLFDGEIIPEAIAVDVDEERESPAEGKLPGGSAPMHYKKRLMKCYMEDSKEPRDSGVPEDPEVPEAPENPEDRFRKLRWLQLVCNHESEALKRITEPVPSNAELPAAEEAIDVDLEEHEYGNFGDNGDEDDGFSDDETVIDDEEATWKDSEGPEAPEDPEDPFLENGSLQDHSGEKSYQCDAAFSRQEALRHHTLICDYPGCNRSFRSEKTLEDHKRRIHEEPDPWKRFVCKHPGCGKRFQHNCHLKIHLRSHDGVKPFVCDWPACDYKTARIGNLNSHQRKLKHICERSS